ncbi:class I SAM-dependent methyltransferase [Methanolobus psychrotolerans]|uniref:class I SAM-dependent methyltransferase n=1 Tax=Methanolobus psychrotolerans TaxID=1874706 RepID=UPI000B917E68|nr:methyltransferase domain-containing protein [Methanolobus psychrotolerans]
MDILPFMDEIFDIVVTSVAFCETTFYVRKGAIMEVSRVLKNNGFFAIVDCAKPILGMDTVMLPPFFMFKENADSWNDHYPDICRNNGLKLVKDIYIYIYIYNILC